MDLIQEITGLIGAAGSGVIGLLGLGAGGAAVRFIREGERGLKLRFGKALRDRNGVPIIVAPGWCWVWPMVEKLHRAHVRHDTINLVNQLVTLKDGTVFRLSAVVTFHVEDTPAAVYRILIEIQDARRSLADFALSTLREVVCAKDWKEVVADKGAIDAELLTMVKEQAGAWGAVITRFSLTDCQPVGDTAHIIQAESNTNARVDALKHAAESLGIEASKLNPQLAAALIGTPLVVAVGGGSSSSTSANGDDSDDDDEDDE